MRDLLKRYRLWACRNGLRPPVGEWYLEAGGAYRVLPDGSLDRREMTYDETTEWVSRTAW
jgi:hypothetical protein